MKEAVLTLAAEKKYRVGFFDRGILIEVHIGRCRTKVRDVLKQSGLDIRRGQQLQWWPLIVGEERRFVVESPAAWFWNAT